MDLKDEREKKRILWIGDAVSHTGFARVTHNVVKYLTHNYNVDVLGMNYFGDPHDYDYRIYPAPPGGDVWGLRRFMSIYEMTKPDIIVIINDPHIVAAFLDQKSEDFETPMIAYMPVDSINQNKEACSKLNALDLAICYTKFGVEEIKIGGYTGKTLVIPHGVDIKNYHPVDKKKARDIMGISQALGDDLFIIGNVNRNQPRKRLDQTVDVFARWVKKYNIPENVYLYCHCAQRDIGWNLLELAKYHGVDKRFIVPDESITSFYGIDEIGLKNIYNAFDVQMSTTMGEGWGLTQFEGMACGIPQIVPRFSALAEWADGCAEYVEVKEFMATPGGMNTIGAIADSEKYIESLNYLYRDEERRKTLRTRGMELVSRPEFAWHDVANKFLITINNILEGESNEESAA